MLRKKKMLMTYFILIAILTINTVLNPSKKQTITRSVPAATISLAPGFSRVTKVIDGDTIEIETGQKVRYIGIDTPETNSPQKKKECFAQEAKQKNKELTEGKIIQMEKDVSETDRYGRLLRYVYILPDDASKSATLFVNAYLVQEGYAYAASFPPDIKHNEEFRALQQEAMEKKKGLWSKCPS